jgi:hypothetical protein
VPAGNLRDDRDRIVASFDQNHLSRVTIDLPQPARTRRVTLELMPPASGAPAALFAVRCYAACE